MYSCPSWAYLRLDQRQNKVVNERAILLKSIIPTMEPQSNEGTEQVAELSMLMHLGAQQRWQIGYTLQLHWKLAQLDGR